MLRGESSQTMWRTGAPKLLACKLCSSLLDERISRQFNRLEISSISQWGNYFKNRNWLLKFLHDISSNFSVSFQDFLKNLRLLVFWKMISWSWSLGCVYFGICANNTIPVFWSDLESMGHLNSIIIQTVCLILEDCFPKHFCPFRRPGSGHINHEDTLFYIEGCWDTDQSGLVLSLLPFSYWILHM